MEQPVFQIPLLEIITVNAWQGSQEKLAQAKQHVRN